jgi:hypothetical protein
MHYMPDPQSLVYSEIHFVSIAAPKGQARVCVDLDRIYDEVSAEISALFFGEVSQPETHFNYAPSISYAGVEVAN